MAEIDRDERIALDLLKVVVSIDPVTKRKPEETYDIYLECLNTVREIKK